MRFARYFQESEEDVSLSSDPDVETTAHNDGVRIVIHKHKRSESLQSLEDPGNAVSNKKLHLLAN